MHRCLEIPELVVEICLQCNEHSLAMLACTARLFDCALDILWSGQHTDWALIHLFVLVQCFPSEIRTTKPITFMAPLEPRHWDRFNFYAGRVRALEVSCGYVHTTALSLLSACAPPGGLLPNLEHLYLEGGDEILHARGFLTPKLQSLKIEPSEITKSEHSFISLLLAIPTVCSDIIELVLRPPESMLHRILPKHIGNLPNLRGLQLEEVSAEYLPVITSVPTLTSLILYITDGEVTPWMGACNALVDLEIAASDGLLLTFFNSLPRCPLETISLSIDLFTNPIKMAEIIRVFANKCQTDTLCSVEIHANLMFEPVIGKNLAPFLDFHGITRFQFSLHGSLCLDDSFISALAASLPNLVELHLEHHPKATMVQFTRPTAKSLGLLAAHCPKLTFIGLEFDATTVNPISSEDIDESHGHHPASLAVCNRSVRTLRVGHSPISEPTPVATFLRTLFPSLRSIHYNRYLPPYMEQDARSIYLERWDSVECAIR